MDASSIRVAVLFAVLAAAGAEYDTFFDFPETEPFSEVAPMEFDPNVADRPYRPPKTFVDLFILRALKEAVHTVDAFPQEILDAVPFPGRSVLIDPQDLAEDPEVVAGLYEPPVKSVTTIRKKFDYLDDAL